MFGKNPKNTKEYYWTQHAIFKMHQYGLGEQKVRNVIRNYRRKEEGIVKDTIAVMQPINPKTINGKEIWKQEVWVMYQNHIARNTKHIAKKQIRIISAWRYPGVSPKRNPIPEEILREIAEIGE
jgi:hypothetical protein